VNLPRKVFTAGWIAIGVSAVGLEVAALVNKTPGGTLSEHIWRLADLHPIFWFIGLTVLNWSMLHLFGRRRNDE